MTVRLRVSGDPDEIEVMLKVLGVVFDFTGWASVLSVLAALTMTLGNLAAIRQENAEASNRVIGPIPFSPATMARQFSSLPIPRGETSPAPVTATRRGEETRGMGFSFAGSSSRCTRRRP